MSKNTIEKNPNTGYTAMAARITLESKSLLARLLSEENLLIEHNTEAETAYFDPENRRLVLPAWDGLDNDTSDMLIGHEVGHALFSPFGIKPIEMAIKYIDKDRPQLVGAYLNIIEDARIERLIKERYPGLSHNFCRAYTKMYDTNQFDFKDRVKNISDLPLIDKLNLRAKVGTHVEMDIPLDPVAQGFFDEMMKTETWDEVVLLTKKIYDSLTDHGAPEPKNGGNGDGKKKGKDKGNEKGKGKGKGKGRGKGSDSLDDSDDCGGLGAPSDDESDESSEDSSGGGDDDQDSSDDESDDSDSSDEGDEEGDEGSSSDEEGDEDGDSKKSNPGDKAEESEEKADSESKSEKEDKSADGDAKSSSEKKKDVETAKDPVTGNPAKVAKVGDNDSERPKKVPPPSITNDSFTKMVRSFGKKGSRGEIKYVDIPEVIESKEVIVEYRKFLESFDTVFSKLGGTAQAYLDELYSQFKSDSSNYVNMMVKDFEMKKAADMHARTTLSNSGVINTNRLHAYKHTEDIFKRMATVREGKNHGIVMFIDWSSSMGDCIGSTVKQLLNLVHFCRRVNIPFEVYAFSNNPGVLAEIGLYDHKTGSYTKKRENVVDPHALVNFLSNRMSANEFNRACKYLLHCGNFYEFGKDAAGFPARTGNSLPNAYTLHGTPLNSAILDAFDIVPKFQKANNVQIVNTIVLTDGEDSTSLLGSLDSNTKLLVVRDKKTRSQVATNVKSENGCYRNNIHTNLLLTMLKNRTGCNLVGFYLINAQGGKRVLCDMSNIRQGSPEATEAIAFFKEKKFYEIKNSGYDAYFIIPSDELDTKLEAKDDYLTKNYTKGRLATAFSETLKKRKVNRIVLSRFIDIIAKTRTEFLKK